MRVFTYPIILKLLYRFGNIPVTLFLSLYLVYFVVSIDIHILYIIPLIVTLLLIYFLNKHYLMLYKLMPFRITADDDKIVCDRFLFAGKTVTIYFNDVSSLSGGLFSSRQTGLMKVCDGKNNICIGFYHRIKDARILETLLLSKVKKEVYDDVLNKISSGKK